MRRLAAVVLALGACREAPVAPLPPGALAAPDAGAAPTLPPPPVDAGSPPSTSTRRLVSWSPTGTLPPDNLVLNPRLDVVSALAPQGLVEPPRQYVWPRTPTDQPVLRVAVRDIASVRVQSRPGALGAQVWIGRPAADARLFARVSLVGLVVDAEGAREVPLAVEEAQERRMNGVVWRRFAAQSPPGFIGHLQLVFDNRAEQPLYVNGPVVLPSRRGAARGAEIAAPQVDFRPVPARRARAYQTFEARERAALLDRLAPPAFERRPSVF